jgi:1,4-alpha-glucan branching enzyme
VESEGIVRKIKTTLHKTSFHCEAPKAERVFVAGTFNAWDQAAVPMERDAAGHWTVSLALASGTYEYKFVVDGQWFCEPGCDEECRSYPECVANPFGTMNRVVTVE